MLQGRRSALAIGLVAALGLVAGWQGCAPAEAGPIEVTYYYLPG